MSRLFYMYLGEDERKFFNIQVPVFDTHLLLNNVVQHSEIYCFLHISLARGSVQGHGI